MLIRGDWPRLAPDRETPECRAYCWPAWIGSRTRAYSRRWLASPSLAALRRCPFCKRHLCYQPRVAGQQVRHGPFPKHVMSKHNSIVLQLSKSSALDQAVEWASQFCTSIVGRNRREIVLGHAIQNATSIAEQAVILSVSMGPPLLCHLRLSCRPWQVLVAAYKGVTTGTGSARLVLRDGNQRAVAKDALLPRVTPPPRYRRGLE